MWMQKALEQARRSIAACQSPFGAVIVRGDEMVAAGHNEVWLRCDPTAHAEITCIQRAAQALGTIRLAGCRMYTTCEPCPMCASAIHWAKLDAVYHGAAIADAARAGFAELRLPTAEVYRIGQSRVQAVGGICAAQCAALFAEWADGASARAY